MNLAGLLLTLSLLFNNTPSNTTFEEPNSISVSENIQDTSIVKMTLNTEELSLSKVHLLNKYFTNNLKKFNKKGIFNIHINLYYNADSSSISSLELTVQYSKKLDESTKDIVTGYIAFVLQDYALFLKIECNQEDNLLYKKLMNIQQNISLFISKYENNDLIIKNNTQGALIFAGILNKEKREKVHKYLTENNTAINGNISLPKRIQELTSHEIEIYTYYYIIDQETQQTYVYLSTTKKFTDANISSLSLNYFMNLTYILQQIPE